MEFIAELDVTGEKELVECFYQAVLRRRTFREWEQADVQ